MTVVGRWRCAACGRFSTTGYRPVGHRRWIGTSLRTCGPFEPVPPTRIEVTV